MVLNKWFVALLQLVITAVTGLQALRADGISATEAWQFAGMIVAAFGVVFLPLLENGWHQAVKVIVALVGAGITAIVPLVTNDWSIDSAIIVALAVLNAAAVQFGVDARIDGVKAVVSDPAQSNSKAAAVDPVVYRIVRTALTAEPNAVS